MSLPILHRRHQNRRVRPSWQIFEPTRSTPWSDGGRQRNHTAHSAQLLYDFIGRSNDYPLERRFAAGVALLEHETPERRAILRAAIITEFLPRHTKLLYKHLSRDDLSPQEFAAGGSALAEYHGFEKALAWAAKLPLEGGGEHALRGVATKWVKHDLKEADQGILAQQPGAVRDVLIEVMVEHLFRKEQSEDARKLLPSIHDAGKRRTLQNMIDGNNKRKD